MFIRDIMTAPVVQVGPAEPLGIAIEKMAAHGVSCTIISKADELVGIITERDITRLAAANAQGFEQICAEPIQNLNLSYPTVVFEDTPLADALMLSRSKGFRHLPVVTKNRRLAGIVTQTDIAEASLKLMSEGTNLKETIEELKLLSMEDPLLDIPNRRAMEAELNYLDSYARRHQQSYCICLIDIDYFKKYNDCYGHQKGDEALKSVSAKLNLAKRQSDRLFRYGGEEFLVSMQNTELKEAIQAGERLRHAVEGMGYQHEDCQLGILTISIGIAESLRQRWRDVVKQADQALYTAKESGRNRVEFFQKNY